MYRKFTGTAFLMIASKGIAMLSAIICARYLGPEQYGLYGYAMSIISLATLPAIAGLPNLLIREVAKYHLDKRWELLKGVIQWSRFYVIAMSIFVVSIIYVALTLGFFKDSLSSLLLWAVLLIPMRGILTQQGAVLNGLRKPILAQMPKDILAPTIILAFLFLGLVLEVNLTALMLVYLTIMASVIAIALSALLLSKPLKKSLKNIKPEFTINNWHSCLLPFSIIAIVSTLNTELATVLLGWLTDTESVAFFKVSMQLVLLITLVFTAINLVIMPNVARLFKGGELNQIQALLSRCVKVSVFVSLPIFLIFLFLGDIVITMLFGKDYVDAYPILVIICCGQYFNLFFGSVGVVIGMTGNEKLALRTLVITLGFNIVILSVLVPLYGSVGAAFAVSLSLFCWNFLMARDIWRLTNLKTWFQIKVG